MFDSELQRRIELTSLYVIHNQKEALGVSDRIIVVADGRIAQIGTPSDIYGQSRTHFVADFVGASTIIPGTSSWMNVKERSALCTERRDAMAHCLRLEALKSGGLRRPLREVRMSLSYLLSDGSAGALGWPDRVPDQVARYPLKGGSRRAACLGRAQVSRH